MLDLSPTVKFALFAALAAVIINVLVGIIAEKSATETQKQPHADHEFFDEIVQMLYHHNKVVVSSSFIIFAVTFISVLAAPHLQTAILATSARGQAAYSQYRGR